MTTDSLKSFITLPTTTIYGRQRSENTKFILLSSFVLIFSIGISSYVIWSSIRMTELRDELNGLRGKLEDLRKRMGLDLLDDLHDFEEAHELPKHHQGFLEDFGNSVDELDDEDYSIDDLEMDDDDDTENMREGSGIFKMFPDDEEYDNESIYDEIRKSRKPRAIPPHEGVPVVEESYALRRNRTNTPADEMVMNVLLNRNQSPKLKYDWGQKKRWAGNERRPPNSIHRRPPRRYQSLSASPTQFVDKDVTLTIRESDTNPQKELNIRHRNHHHLNTQPNLQEHVAAPEQRVYRRQFANSGEQKSHGNKSRTIAIHYEGDESKYRLLTPHHYKKDNALLHHVTGNYDYWKPSTWAVEAGMENYFTLEEGGVTVKESGVYLIYAQIYYNDKRDSYSFTIRRNGNPILLCEVTSRNDHSHSNHDTQNKNTCYTSGVAFLQADDRIQVKSGENQHYVLFHPHTSFFGLIRLGGPASHHAPNSAPGTNLISHEDSRRIYS
ncbi:protein eiger isoform X2 [Lutzomyia longipalpis]|uniref:protein eiger isoform X2 n=1 Tax=Lutzomyia longipalpis TaxID=7200 RepID=UPI0024839895|nr:protein eiger isoform X2 [Lutzomyia longipalpis]